MRKLTLRDVSRASGVALTTTRNWLLHSEFTFGERIITGQWRFGANDARGIALTAALVEGGLTPRLALRHAATLIERSRGLPLVAVAAADPKMSPALIPLDRVPKLAGRPLVLVDLGELFASVDARLSA